MSLLSILSHAVVEVNFPSFLLQIAEKDKTIEDLQQRLNECELANDNLRADRDRILQERASTSQELSQARTAQEIELNEKRTRIRTLEDELKKANEKANALNAELENVARSCSFISRPFYSHYFLPVRSEIER